MENEVYKVSPRIIEKWLPLIEGKGDFAEFVAECPKVKSKDYAMLAQMLENSEKQNVNAPVYAESTATDSPAVGAYSPILIPMLRRVVPAMIGPQIFGTWPMNMPTGLIFSRRAEYQNDSVNPVGGNSGKTGVVLTISGSGVAGLVLGATLTGATSGATGTVRYKETTSTTTANVLVEKTNTTAFQAAETVATNVATTAVYDNEALFSMILPGYTGPYATAAAEKMSTNIKEIGTKIETLSVTAKGRLLKAKWSLEVEEDMAAVNGLDARAVLAADSTDEIIREMNREFIDLIKAKATYTSAYDYTSTASGAGSWELEKYQNAAAAISRAKRAIIKQSYRGQGTWAIVSPAVLTLLETSGRLDDRNVDPVQEVYAGRALGMNIFCDIFATNNDVYVGHKGNTEMDAGHFYCPYKAIEMRSAVSEEAFQPRALFRTRYAMAENPYGASTFYHKLTMANIPE